MPHKHKATADEKVRAVRALQATWDGQKQPTSFPSLTRVDDTIVAKTVEFHGVSAVCDAS